MLSKKMHGQPLVYFDSAATAQKPQVVIDSLTHFYADAYGTAHRAVYELSIYATKSYDESREKLRRFFNAARKEEIIFTRGTTESINLIAYSFGKAFIQPGDEILISAMEHHSNIVPWQIICQDRGAHLKIAPITEQGCLDLEYFEKLITQRTKLISIAHISNVLGTVNPIKKITEIAHKKGVPVLVDGAQSAPHLPVDVQDLGCDFYVCSGHKLFGPTGIGVLYGKYDLLEKMPPYQGGGDMIQTVTFQESTYQKPPLRFEAGTPILAEAIALGTAIDYIESIGREAISAHENDLLAHATDALSAIPGLTIIGQAPEKGAIISFTIDGSHPLDLGTFLDLKGFALRTGHLCAQPLLELYHKTAVARASFAFYNTHEEVDRFVHALHDIVKMLHS